MTIKLSPKLPDIKKNIIKIQIGIIFSSLIIDVVLIFMMNNIINEPNQIDIGLFSILMIIVCYKLCIITQFLDYEYNKLSLKQKMERI